MLVGFINDHHFPALFPEGRQPVCHCGLCVTSCLLFFFPVRGQSENLEEKVVHPDGQLPLLL